MSTYTTLKDVKEILTLGNDKSFMFSDCLAEVILTGADKRPNVKMIFNPQDVEIDETYSGFMDLKIIFTSSTEYEVYRMDKQMRQQRLVSTGDILGDWLTPDGKIKIPASAWGGTIAKDDVVDLGFRSYISDKFAESMIKDTEILVDVMIMKTGVMFLEPGKDRLWDVAGDVPPNVQVATKYLSAYYIYTDTFQDKFRDESNFQETFVKRWKRRAELYIQGFADALGFSTPSVLAFPQYMPNQFGDADVGPGYAGMSTRKEDVVRDSGASNIFER